MHTDKELYHLVRISKSVESDNAESAFYLLITSLYMDYGHLLRPASQGNFSVLQVRPDGDNVFAFKGAKNWIRWYFRKPAFSKGFANYQQILDTFAGAEEVQGGEIAVNIHDASEARAVLEYIRGYLCSRVNETP